MQPDTLISSNIKYLINYINKDISIWFVTTNYVVYVSFIIKYSVNYSSQIKKISLRCLQWNFRKPWVIELFWCLCFPVTDPCADALCQSYNFCLYENQAGPCMCAGNWTGPSCTDSQYSKCTHHFFTLEPLAAICVMPKGTVGRL